MIPNRMSGMTLIELLVVMTIAAILLGVGVPSFRYVTNSNRMSGEINNLLGDLQFARSEALKEGQTVTICSSTDGINCGTASWDRGWMVFSAVNPSLRTQPAFQGSDTLTFDNSIQAITFNREGFANEPLKYPPTAALTATLHDKTANVAWSRCLVVTAGRIVTEPSGPASATQLTVCR